MRAVDGGAASGPYSLPGKVRMSTDSATSKRCSSLQSTICAGVRRAFRPVQAVAALGVVERVVAAGGPREIAPAVRPMGRPVCGSAVMRPAMRRPPSAVSSSARRVEAACRLRHHARCGRRSSSPRRACQFAPRSGASNIGSIVTGVSGAVTRDAVVMLCGCARVTSICPRLGAESRVAAVIDLKLLREDPDRVRASQRARGEDPGLVDALLEADAARRAAISAADNLRAEQKAASKRVGGLARRAARAAGAGQGTRRAGQGRRGRAGATPKRRSPQRIWRSPT